MSLGLLVRLVCTWMKSPLKFIREETDTGERENEKEGRAGQVQQGRYPLGAEVRQSARSLRNMIMDGSDITFKICSHYDPSCQ